jgi:hypothetical protein
MRIKELDFIQTAERLWFMQHHPADLRELRRKHQRDRVELHRKNRNERLRVKAEKALRDKSKIEPDFWNDFPNHNGRRDTMAAVLTSLGQPKEQAMEIMTTYATWLLTANKMRENGRPKNRWALMTAFVESRLPPHGEVKRMLKPESVIVQMLIERGDLVVGNII